MVEVRFWRNGLGEEKWDTTQLNTVAGSQLYDRVIAIQPVIRLTILLYLILSLILPVCLTYFFLFQASHYLSLNIHPLYFISINLRDSQLGAGATVTLYCGHRER